MDAQEVMHMTDYSKITALYRQIDVARLWHCSRSAVAQRFKKIKKFLNNT